MEAKDILREFPDLSVPGEEKINSLEGFLFPDTYYFEKNEDPRQVAETMVGNLSKKITKEMHRDIEKRGCSFYDILKMASLLEKEVKSYQDKRIVSGILWKRLENGIPLQVDATINYLTGRKNLKISGRDLQIDSPYNTYKYKGLPPQPICNPGLDSIKAAIYPKSSEFWYYLSTPDGRTIFSKTFREHKIAKQRYLR